MRIKYNLRRSVEFVNFMLGLCRQEHFKNYISNDAEQSRVNIFANGPSLNNTLNEMIESKRYLSEIILTMNFFVNDDRYEIIKPKYHAISDPMFYDAPGHEERVADFFVNINKKTTWPLKLIVSYRFWKDSEWRKRFTNSIITLIPFHVITPPYDCLGFKWLSRRGLMGADYGSVLHQAIYAMMLSGYKEIVLYGADHTFFDGLCVNEKNQVCKKTTHFYECDTQVEPIFHTYTGVKTPYTMSHFLSEYARVFKGHEILQQISKNFGAMIFNATPGSMIDAYERKT